MKTVHGGKPITREKIMRTVKYYQRNMTKASAERTREVMVDIADIPVALLFAELLGLLEGPDESAEPDLVTTIIVELGVAVAVSSGSELVMRMADELGTVIEELASGVPEAGTELGTAATPPPPPPLGGGGAALEGSARAPTPQGIGALVPGSRALAGGVVAPVGSAIVNRVVQVLLAAVGEVNW